MADMPVRRGARDPNLRRKFEWFLVIHFHLIIVVAMVLVIIGLVKLTGNNPQESDTKLPKIGAVIILLGWAVLVGGTAFSFRSSQYDKQAPAYRSGTKVSLSSSFQVQQMLMRKNSCSTESPSLYRLLASESSTQCSPIL